MNSSELAEMKEDRLANFAVAAFLGSLLMGQALDMWEGSQGTTKLLMFTVPDYPRFVIFTFMASFFVLSLFLAAASMLTPLHRWGLATTRSVAPIMLPIVSVSFILSWLSSTLELPDDQWWTPVLFVAGFVMFLFIGFRRTLTSLFRFVRQRVRLIPGNKPVANAEPDSQSNGIPSGPPERVAFPKWMRSLRGFFRVTQSGEFWIALSVVVMVVEVLLVVVLWDWLAKGESGSATIRNIGLVIAGSLAIPLAIWRTVVADKQASSAQYQTTIAQQGLLNERYQKGAEMLGSAVLSVRLGGIYGLASLAEDHPDQYRVPIFQLLCTFVRRPPEEGKRDETEQVHREKSDSDYELRQDVQAAMTAISERSEAGLGYEKATRGFLIEVTDSVAEGVTVRRAGLFWVDLRGANLKYVDLLEAKLSWANFNDADLSNSTLLEANLSHARLWKANLSHARLWKADLSKADISQSAILSNADLTNANLSDANLFLADLSGASLRGANLSGVVLQRANLTGADLSEVTGLEQYSLNSGRADPNNPPKLRNAFDAKTGKPLEWHGRS